MTTTPVPPPVSRPPRADLWRTVGVIAVLCVAAAAVGGLDWPLPDRVVGGPQVAAVPTSLAVLLAVSTVLCLVVASWWTARIFGLRLRTPAGLAWLGIVVAAALVLAFNALLLAAYAGVVVGAIIPVFHWLFTPVPALLAGAVSMRRGAAAATTAAVSTGMVTLPLFGLGWALFHSPDGLAGAAASALWSTAILGVAPLGLAVLVAGGWGRRYEWRAAEAGGNKVRR
ncbi:hypothetical protein [Blastococcus sp. PRF04-17]|uniref:hypothetical protein n=1 Tax=Blastococcus sp. PRF04-17 TaxID=2933797 RepID=UPI001FF493A5|nr:hypothetical protein [Blastococcus sp. PRF04-17]UOY01999.1 hypothetical protein MVA48_01010 [Blastococcus sp. PRF04-17]